MCEVPGLGIDIPSPLDVVRSLASLVGAVGPRTLAGIAVSGAVVAFTFEHAVVIGVAAAVFLAAMCGVLAVMRMPDHIPVPEQAAPPLPRNLAITAGRRAIEAPRVVLPGQVLTAAEGEKVSSSV